MKKCLLCKKEDIRRKKIFCKKCLNKDIFLKLKVFKESEDLDQDFRYAHNSKKARLFPKGKGKDSKHLKKAQRAYIKKSDAYKKLSHTSKSKRHNGRNSQGV